MRLSWLCEQDALWITLILWLAMMLAAELGYFAGFRSHPHFESAAKDHFGAIKNALLGLLALLLAFSFGMSAQRYDARRQLVMQDALPLNALYLRSSLLPDPQRAQFKKMLARYVDLRTEKRLVEGTLSPDQLTQAIAESDAVYAQMWTLIQTLAQHEPPTPAANDMFPQRNEASDMQAKRVQAYISSVPDPVIWLLLTAAVTAMTAIGYSGGLIKHRGILARFLYAFVLCATIFVILQMDQSTHSLLRIDQRPMLHLQQTLALDPETRT